MRRALWLGLLGSVSALGGCEEVRVREEPAGRTPSFIAQAARVETSPSGLRAMYARQIAEAGGLRLEAQARQGPGEVVLGPLDAALEVRQLRATPEEGAVALELSWRELTIVVPTRRPSPSGATLCRLGVRSAQATLTTRAVLIQDEAGARLEPEPAVITLVAPTVEPLGACALSAQLDQTPGAWDALRQDALLYAREALAQASRQGLALEPVAALGLMVRRLELTGQSPLRDRVGQLALGGRLREGVSLSATQGLLMGLDHDLQALTPADCVARVELGPIGAQGVDPIGAQALANAGADVAMALPLGVVTRLAQVATRGGFLCSGLEDLGEAQLTSLATREALLESLGMPELELGAWLSPTLSPGALPTLSADPVADRLRVSWPLMTSTLYGQRFGTPVKLLEVTATLTMSLRLRATASGALGLQVEAVEVSQPELRSPWLARPPQDEALALWTRRYMLLLLGQEVVLPLPLEPDSPLRAVGAQVRARDVVLFLRGSGG